MGDDEEVEAAGLYTGLCSTFTTQSLGSLQLLLKKKSTAVDTELRSGGAVCTLALQEDDH